MSDRRLCNITYEDVFTSIEKETNKRSKQKKQTLVIEACQSDRFYKCRFPFSWICRNVINSQTQDILKQRESSTNAFVKIMELVQESPLGSVFNSNIVPNDEEVHNELCKLYLDDYIDAMYHPSMDDEHKLIHAAVQSRYNAKSVDILVSKPYTFLKKLIILHLAYDELEPQLQQFKQLISFRPQLLSSLKDKFTDSKYDISDIALRAVELLVDKLEYNKNKKWNHADTLNWLVEIAQYQSSIVSVLSMTTTDASDTKKKWMNILIAKTFAVIVRYDKEYRNDHTLNFMKRTKFSITPDFKTSASLRKISKLLNIMQDDMKSCYKLEETEKMTELIWRCKVFFIEIISCFCFEQIYDSKDPTIDLIEYLVDCVEKDVAETLPLSLDQNVEDTIPIVGSYLLKLLIGVKADERDDFKDCFYKLLKWNKIKDDKINKELCILCIQCFEDEHYKSALRYSKPDEVAQNCLSLLKHNYNNYQVQKYSIENLKAIAALRYCLCELAKYLCTKIQHETKCDKWTKVIEFIQGIYYQAKAKYPAEYFVKYIVLHYGTSQFILLRESHRWIIPVHLKTAGRKKDCIISATQVYCDNVDYGNLSEAMSIFAESLNSTELDELLKKLDSPNNCVLIIMAVYANVVLKLPSVQDKSRKVVEHLSTFIDNSTAFNYEMKKMAKYILDNDCNKQIQTKVKFRDTTQSEQMVGILVHCVSVFLQHKDVNFLKPCIALLENPQTLYLPTMPMAEPAAVFDNFKTVHYTCDNNHTFLIAIDDLETTSKTVKCQICNTEASEYEVNIIETGHTIGKADARGEEPEGIRNLTAVSCSVIRVLLHSILTWSSLKDDLTGFHNFLTPEIADGYLPRFFWNNLEKDLTLLATSLSRNFDDSVLTIHLLLKNMSQLAAENYPYVDDDNWCTDERRTIWENKMSEFLIEPLIKSIPSKLTAINSLMVKDAGPLYSKIYESVVDSDEHNAILSAFWRYRTRVSLEHLLYSLNKEEHKILFKFLQKERILRAMQYLPAILKLQRYMFDLFHQQMGQDRALDRTIGKYKDSLVKGKEMFTEMVQKFGKAWLLVKRHLTSYGGLRVPHEYVNDTPEITDDTKLTYLLPSDTGEGVCIRSLVDYLVNQQNDFIKFCYKKENIPVTHYAPESICEKLMQHATQLSQLQPCHVISYESKLLPLVLARSQYSLEYGKGREVEYDYTAIEKDLFDKFIFGKPLILVEEMPIVVLNNDAFFYDSIAVKVPQVDIPSEKKKNLINTIKKLNDHKLSELVDIIDVVLRFLASSGGDGDKEIQSYVTTTLAIQRTLPKLVGDCVLANAISLWGAVSVVRCCKMTSLEKEPFYRLDEAFCETCCEVDLQQTIRKIEQESTNDFLISLHNFIVVYVSNVSSDDCKPWWSLTATWIAKMETSHVQLKVDLMSIPYAVQMRHVADVWKQAVKQLWLKELS